MEPTPGARHSGASAPSRGLRRQSAEGKRASPPSSPRAAGSARGSDPRLRQRAPAARTPRPLSGHPSLGPRSYLISAAAAAELGAPGASVRPWPFGRLPGDPDRSGADSLWRRRLGPWGSPRSDHSETNRTGERGARGFSPPPANPTRRALGSLGGRSRDWRGLEPGCGRAHQSEEGRPCAPGDGSAPQSGAWLRTPGKGTSWDSAFWPALRVPASGCRST